MIVIKRDGRAEPFDADKIKKAIAKAAIGSGVSLDDIKQDVDGIAEKIINLTQQTAKIESRQIKEQILKELEAISEKIPEAMRRFDQKYKEPNLSDKNRKLEEEVKQAEEEKKEFVEEAKMIPVVEGEVSSHAADTAEIEEELPAEEYSKTTYRYSEEGENKPYGKDGTQGGYPGPQENMPEYKEEKSSETPDQPAPVIGSYDWLMERYVDKLSGLPPKSLIVKNDKRKDITKAKIGKK